MSAIEFVAAAAEFMVKDRPDVYTQNKAEMDLMRMMEETRLGGHGSVVTFTSYVLTYLQDDGMDEWILSRKIASMCFFEGEDDLVTGWTKGSGVLSESVNLRDVNDDYPLPLDDVDYI